MKENSTIGRSKLDPREYKGDSLAQAWVDRRELATLSIWLEGAGWQPRTLSDLLKFTIKAVVMNLVDNGIVEKVEHTGDADLIMRKYKANLNPGGRGLKNLSHNLILDDRMGDSGSLTERVRKETEEGLKKYQEMVDSGEIESPRDRKIREQVEKQKKDALGKAVKVDEPKVDVDKNMSIAKANDDKIKDMP